MQLKRLALAAMIVITLATNASAISWCSLWGTCPPPGPPPFAPAYVTPTPTISNGFGDVRSVNPWYFATQATADIVCQKLGCAYTFARECEMGGGPATCSALEIMLAFPGTPPLFENAGLMASYWTRNPEDQFPNVALSLAKAQIASDRASLPRVTSASRILLFPIDPFEIDRPKTHTEILRALFPDFDWRFI